MSNKLVLQEMDTQLTIVVGQLALVLSQDDKNDEDCILLLRTAATELIGLVEGLRNVLNHQPPTHH